MAMEVNITNEAYNDISKVFGCAIITGIFSGIITKAFGK